MAKQKGLNPRKAYVEVYLPYEKGSEFKPIYFYRTKTQSGTPELILDKKGLLQSGRALCQWPDGRYNSARNSKMLLRPACPLPVVSQWDKQGLGGASLYIQYDKKINSKMIQATFQGKPIFVDLKNYSLDDFKFFKSKNLQKKEQLANSKKILNHPKFKKFVELASQCLDKRDPDCMEAWTKPSYYVPNAKRDLDCGKSEKTVELSRKVFSRCAADKNTRLHFLLKGCFVDLLAANINGDLEYLTINTAEGGCVLESTEPGAWTIKSLIIEERSW